MARNRIRSPKKREYLVDLEAIVLSAKKNEKKGRRLSFKPHQMRSQIKKDAISPFGLLPPRVPTLQNRFPPIIPRLEFGNLPKHLLLKKAPER